MGTWGAVGTCCGCLCTLSVRVHPAPRPSAFLPPPPRDCFCDLELRCATERAGGGDRSLWGHRTPVPGDLGGNGIAWTPRSDPSSEVFGSRTHGAGTLEAGSQRGVPRTRVRGGEDARNWVPGVQGGPGLPGPPRCPARGSPTAEDSFGARSPATARGRDGRTGSPREGGRRCGAGGRRAGGGCGSGLRDFV